MTSPGPMVHTSGPIRPEELAERYAGRWTIYRVLHEDGTRGDWVASPCRPAKDRQLKARSIAYLAHQLQRAAGA
jgi:hypothetical protein